MFGYVNIYKDELKIKDYNVFRAYYCGLCKAIGRCGSHIARMGLSYDMTFLALLLSSLEEGGPEIELRRCLLHPFHKRGNAVNDKAIDYAAYMSVILAYLKLADDAADDKSIKARIGMLLYIPAVRRSRKKYPSEYGRIKDLLDELSALEKENCSDPDRAADCFARILELLFVPEFVTDEAKRRSLAWMGYNIGRWIYLIDAFADMEKDEKKGSYNVFLAGKNACRDKDRLAKATDDALILTLANAASAYDLLEIKKNKDILDNILLLSLKMKQQYIIYCHKEKRCEKLPGRKEKGE